MCLYFLVYAFYVWQVCLGVFLFFSLPSELDGRCNIVRCCHLQSCCCVLAESLSIIVLFSVIVFIVSVCAFHHAV